VKQAQMTVMAHTKYINCVKVSPNDKLIASSSQDKTIKLWLAKDLSQTLELRGHKRGIWDLAFAPTEQLLMSASGDKMLKVWSIAGDNKGQCVATL
jgi:U3 small nucleolar RNA-associated protein 13